MRNIAFFLLMFVLLGSAGAVPDPDLIVEQVRLTLFKVSRSWMSLTPSTLMDHLLFGAIGRFLQSPITKRF